MTWIDELLHKDKEYQNCSVHVFKWKYAFMEMLLPKRNTTSVFMKIYEEPENGSATNSLILASTQQNLSSLFELSDKARLKPVSLSTETSYKIENLCVASLDMILYNKHITKVLADQTA